MVETLLGNPELMTVVGGLFLSVLSSAISAVCPDKASGIMKLVNVFAINVGKAANDGARNS